MPGKGETSWANAGEHNLQQMKISYVSEVQSYTLPDNQVMQEETLKFSLLRLPCFPLWKKAELLNVEFAKENGHRGGKVASTEDSIEDHLNQDCYGLNVFDLLPPNHMLKSQPPKVMVLVGD